MSGFGSGEALVDAVGGDNDRRLLIIETEYSRILAVGKRDGSTLPGLQRQAWDGTRMQVRSRAGTAVADRPHIVIVGHITRAELLARASESDTLGGSLNRFLIVPTRRSKLLPSGGNLDSRVVAGFGRNVAFVAMQARKVGIVRRTAEAEDYWAILYGRLADDDPGGLLGAVIARDAAQILRLSLVYALLDGSHKIEVVHVLAAEAIWNYCRAGAAMIFGERTGDTIADMILTELQRHSAEGLDKTAIRDLLGRHAKGERVDLALALLESRGLATKATKHTHAGGRPRTVIHLVDATKATKATKPSEDEPALSDADLERMGADDDGEATR